jgi:Escherichia/Staphylococcus phage prohead protease
MPEIERRSVGEVRAVGRTLTGLALPYGRTADIGGLFVERFEPGAFRASIERRDDATALVDHDQSNLLGRVRSGTLRVTESPAGLEYSIAVPETTLGADLLVLAQRGDLSGISVGFRARKEGWSDANTRKIIEADLLEISVLRGREPAYSGTSISLRGQNMLRERRLRSMLVVTL